SLARLLTHRREFFLAGVTVVGPAGGKELLGDLPVPRRAGELEHDLAIPGEAEPGEAVDDRVDCGGGRALAVGVLDPQQHLSAGMAGEQPVEQRCAPAADMEKAGRRGREAGDDGFAHRRPLYHRSRRNTAIAPALSGVA